MRSGCDMLRRHLATARFAYASPTASNVLLQLSWVLKLASMLYRATHPTTPLYVTTSAILSHSLACLLVAKGFVLLNSTDSVQIHMMGSVLELSYRMTWAILCRFGCHPLLWINSRTTPLTAGWIWDRPHSSKLIVDREPCIECLQSISARSKAIVMALH